MKGKRDHGKRAGWGGKGEKVCGPDGKEGEKLNRSAASKKAVKNGCRVGNVLG